MLHRSECWALLKADASKTNALDQWCVRRILKNTWWYQHVSNNEVQIQTKQPPLTSISSEKMSTATWSEWMSQLIPGEVLLQFLRMTEEGQLYILKPLGWPQSKAFSHLSPIFPSVHFNNLCHWVWRKPLRWRWTSRSGDYWQKVQQHTEMVQAQQWRRLQLIWLKCTFQHKINITKSSATAEKQCVSSPHGGGGARPSSPLRIRPLWLHLCVWSNPKPATNVPQVRRPLSAL